MKTIYMVMEKLALNISMLGLPAGICVGLLNFANKLDFQWGLNHFNCTVYVVMSVCFPLSFLV